LADLTRSELRQILDFVDESRFDYLELQVGDLRLVVSKTGDLSNDARSSRSSPIGAGEKLNDSDGEPSGSGRQPASSLAQMAYPSDARAVEASSDDGLVTVVSPMVGTFFRRPEPTAQPYTEIGDSVLAESTIGMIELMKVYTSVQAGVNGIVDRILVNDADFVEFGQPLMLIRSGPQP
jgi:acetyl-CoA carboxylase biotin carboxyl carrier protein